MLSAPPSALKSIASTSFRSMSTFATSRKNVARPPLAEMSMFSAAFAPLKSIVSKPAWPSSVSLSSPGFQTKVSFPAPMNAVSSPSPPLKRSSPPLPTKTSTPRPPFIVTRKRPASSPDASITSSPPRPFSVRPSSPPASGPVMRTCAGSPAIVVRPAALVAAVTVSAPLVPFEVTLSAARRPLARSSVTRLTSVPDMSPTTMLSAPPSALKVMRSTSSRSIVTFATSRKKIARPPLAKMSMFSAAPAPLNRSSSVPSWPSTVSLPSPGSHWKRSLPAPRNATSSPLSPKTKSLPLAAEEHVGALAAEHAVVPGAAVDGQADHARGERRRGDGVVSAEPVDDEVVVRALGVRDRDPRRQPRHGDGGPRADHVDGVGGVRPVDDHHVGRAVAGGPADRAGEIDVDFGHVGAR